MEWGKMGRNHSCVVGIWEKSTPLCWWIMATWHEKWVRRVCMYYARGVRVMYLVCSSNPFGRGSATSQLFSPRNGRRIVARKVPNCRSITIASIVYVSNMRHVLTNQHIKNIVEFWPAKEEEKKTTHVHTHPFIQAANISFSIFYFLKCEKRDTTNISGSSYKHYYASTYFSS